jgi:hypothetical protein
MTTAAAIDRLVHHSIIVELNIPSYRLEHARNNVEALGSEPAVVAGAGEPSSGSGLRPSPPVSSPKAKIDVVGS